MNNKAPNWAHSTMVCGGKGTGKSTFVNRIISVTPYKNVLVYLEPVNIMEGTFKPLPEAKFSQYAGGKALIDSTDVDIYTFLDFVEKYFRDGMIVIDEAGLYDLMVRNKANGNLEPCKPLLYILKHQRKYNITIYLIYHSLSEIPVRLIKWMNNFVLFHQVDEFKHKGAVIPRIDELNAAKARIAKKYFGGNRYYNEVIPLM